MRCCFISSFLCFDRQYILYALFLSASVPIMGVIFSSMAASKSSSEKSATSQSSIKSSPYSSERGVEEIVGGGVVAATQLGGGVKERDGDN